MKKILILSALTLAISQNAHANQSYTLMDKDENGTVTHQEFFEANPNFSEMAFQIIDKDKNKEVTLEEWLGFVEMHSRPEGFMEEMKSSTVPAKDGPDAPKSPSMPSMEAMQEMQKMKETAKPTNPTSNPPSLENMGDLPLLSPPKVKETSKVELPKVEAPKVPQIQEPKKPTVESTGNMDDLPLLTPNKK